MIYLFCVKLVSYAAILQRISKYDKFHKRSCVIVLLDFLESTLVCIFVVIYSHLCRFNPKNNFKTLIGFISTALHVEANQKKVCSLEPYYHW